MRKILFLIIFIVFSFFLTACEKEEAKEIISEKEGVEYYQKGEYKKALPLLQKAADSGNAVAFYYLGQMYRQGNGTQKNIGKSCEYFVESAEKEYKKAYFLTSMCYSAGIEFPQDFNRAFKWAQKSADVADEIHMDEDNRLLLANLLGALYANGKGTLQDLSEAARWYQKSAEMGDMVGQSMMAFYTYSGKGVLINKEKAKYWAEKAAAQGSPYGQLILGMLSQYRDQPDMKEALYWYEKAAKQDNKVAYYQLGVIYEKGLEVKQDIPKAHRYYKLAAESGRDYVIQDLIDFEARHNLNKKD